jgi:uncharacterized protein (TIGR02271 family)
VLGNLNHLNDRYKLHGAFINRQTTCKKNQEPIVPANESKSQDEGFLDPGSRDGDQQNVIPVIREQFEVGKRVVQTGKGVRVAKIISKREEVIDEALVKEEVSIERVSINERVADQDMPAVRYEGEKMVVPILQEVVVTERRTILKEECVSRDIVATFAAHNALF